LARQGSAYVWASGRHVVELAERTPTHSDNDARTVNVMPADDSQGAPLLSLGDSPQATSIVLAFGAQALMRIDRESGVVADLRRYLSLQLECALDEDRMFSFERTITGTEADRPPSGEAQAAPTHRSPEMDVEEDEIGPVRRNQDERLGARRSTLTATRPVRGAPCTSRDIAFIFD